MTDQQLLDLFKTNVCQNATFVTEFEDVHWYDLSIGFFIALGADAEQAGRCATHARYKEKYWQ